MEWIINDQKETQNKASIFKEYVDQNNYCIFVGSIRYSSNNSQQLSYLSNCFCVGDKYR